VILLGDDEFKVQEVVGNVNDFQKSKPWEIFSPEILKMLALLSKNILNDSRAKEFPDLIAIGFSIRPTNISMYAKMISGQVLRRGRGRSFHISPSNVPLNFVFSLVFALVAGNPCLVRLSSKTYPQVEVFCDILKSVLASPKFNLMSKSICLVRYDHDQVVTDFFSSISESRIIWGGDETVREIQKSKLPIRSIELVFPDRFSFSLISAKELLELEDSELTVVAGRFFTDSYLFDQRGCSSPKMVCWDGNEMQAEKASIIFWEKVNQIAKQRYDLQIKNSIDKFVEVCQLLAFNDSLNVAYFADNYLLVVNSLLPSTSLNEFQGQYGTFIQSRISNWSELQLIVTPKFQTLTYFGYELEEIKNALSSLSLSGIDRVVPIGQAFEMSINWDGINFVEALSRIIEFK
jgi:hypothetical protein